MRSDPEAACLRTATAAEVALILDWAAAEGWNPGLADAEAFHAADPEGFFVTTLGGEPVAAVSVVRHSDSFAFLGLYLCRPDFRGRGIGYALWCHALAHAGDRTVGLDGVTAQQANYARSGFVRSGASVRYEGQARGLAAVAVPPDMPLRPAEAADLTGLLALDRAACGVERPRFIAAWCREVRGPGGPLRRTLVLQEADAVTGVATARACRDGVKIGPVIAPDDRAAEMLIAAAAGLIPAQRIIVDLPDTAERLSARLLAHGFRPGFETARMYRGEPPRGDGRLHAIASMELG